MARVSQAPCWALRVLDREHGDEGREVVKNWADVYIRSPSYDYGSWNGHLSPGTVPAYIIDSNK